MFEKRLYVGAVIDGTCIKTVELVKTNGIAEKVFTLKTPDAPFTWMGSVIAVSVKEMGVEVVAEKVRESQKKNQSFSIPDCIKQIPMADVNSLMLEIHRTLWQNLIENQTCICKFCGETMVVDIDLDKVEMSEEDLAKSEKEIDHLEYTLKTPFVYHVKGEMSKRDFSDFDGKEFNSLEFRIPLLRDSLKNEKSYKDTVLFWRKIAMDTLTKICQKDEDGKIIDELPLEAVQFMGLGLFDDSFDGKDLKGIRQVLREDLPSIPFMYDERCISCHRVTPVTIEPSSFFSD